MAVEISARSNREEVMSLFTHVARGRLAAWLTVVAAIVVGAAVFGLPRPANPDPVSATGLSAQWQSTVAERLQEQLPDSDVQPALVVAGRSDGGPLTPADTEALAARSRDLSRFAVGGKVAPPQVSPDGKVALIAVPVSTAGGQEQVADTIEGVRAALDGTGAGLTVEVTGGRPSPRT
nr:hypothetical protein GCM10020092_071150 [Actinoplanes digitatis]